MNGQKNITTASERGAVNPAAQELAPLLARRELWLLLSAAYVDPYHHRRFELLMDPAFRARVTSAAALLVREQGSIELGPGEVSPERLSPEGLFAALDAQPENLEGIYRQLFGMTSISPMCPPCEIEYDPNTELVYRCQRFADIAGFYRAFGVKIATRAGERMDHITAETEFLYLLLAKQAAALQTGNEEGFEVSRDAHRNFFQEHVGWWVPAFSRLLVHSAPPGFYRELATLTAALSAWERSCLGLSPFEVPAIPKPSDDACEECMGNQVAT